MIVTSERKFTCDDRRHLRGLATPCPRCVEVTKKDQVIVREFSVTYGGPGVETVGEVYRGTIKGAKSYLVSRRAHKSDGLYPFATSEDNMGCRSLFDVIVEFGQLPDPDESGSGR